MNLKDKTLDAIFIFFSSIGALFIEHWTKGCVIRIYDFFEFTDTTRTSINGFFFSLLLAAVYMVIILILRLISKFTKDRGQLVIHVKNKAKPNSNSIKFSSLTNTENPDPLDMDIRFEIKASRLQLFILKKFKAIIEMKVNPDSFSIEISEGFLNSKDNKDFYSDESVIKINIFHKFEPSKKMNHLTKTFVVLPIYESESELSFKVKFEKAPYLSGLIPTILNIEIKNIKLISG